VTILVTGEQTERVDTRWFPMLSANRSPALRRWKVWRRFLPITLPMASTPQTMSELGSSRSCFGDSSTTGFLSHSKKNQNEKETLRSRKGRFVLVVNKNRGLFQRCRLSTKTGENFRRLGTCVVTHVTRSSRHTLSLVGNQRHLMSPYVTPKRLETVKQIATCCGFCC
jgi:hypothetical protein